MSGRLSPLPRPVVPAASVAQCGDEFKGLMALLAGCELALVDLGTGLSMHSPDAKNRNMEKAKRALETALRDFKRGNNL